MALNISERVNRGREIISNAGPSKLIIGGIILAVSTALLVYFLLSSSPGTSYDVLYSRLSKEDAGAIVAELKRKNVEYRISDDGGTIEIPSNQAPEARLELAMLGLPAKSNVGYEIFDKQKLGATSTEQRTNLMRAVTGELERTIMFMPGVEMARVHLNVPHEAIFIEDQKNATAAVMVKMRGQETLDKAQLMGIVHLVTASVEGLKADDVSIVDGNGTLLWSKDMAKASFLNDDQLKQKRAYEDELKRRITHMLDRVVGPGKSNTIVNADLDYKQVITNEDIFDPERVAVRSEQKIKEQNTGPGRAMAGIPNATYELGTANRQNSGAGGAQETYMRTEETNNYEISNIKRQTVASAGDLKKISATVFVDGTYTTAEDGTKTFVPVPADQLAKLTESIKNAIGFDEARGDSVAVDTIAFYNSGTADSSPYWVLFWIDLAREFLPLFIKLLLIILFFFFVVRPIMNWLKKEVEPVGGGAEPAVLPEYPVSGPSFGDGLPLPAAPSAADLNISIESNGPELEEQLITYDEAPQATAGRYEDEEPEDAPQQLAYGHLNRENVLPLARENMERTVGLVRGWIEQKATAAKQQ